MRIDMMIIRSTIHAYRVPLIVGCLGLASACMSSPGDDDVIASPTTSVTFSGYTKGPGQKPRFLIKDHATGRFTEVGSTTSSTSMTQDAVGMDWYWFSKSMKLPYGYGTNEKYWRAHSRTNGSRAIRAEVKGDCVDVECASFKFDQATHDCVTAASPLGGFEIYNSCRSSRSPVARISTQCGKRDAACCAASNVKTSQFCDEGLRCDLGTNRCSISSSVVEALPLLTLQLKVHVCNAANAGSNGRVTVNVKRERDEMLVELPGDNFRQNQWASIGLGNAPTEFAEVDEIRLRALDTDNLCFDQLKLVANGVDVYSQSFGSGVWIQGGGTTTHVVSAATIRSNLVPNGYQTACNIPSGLSYEQLFDMVAGTVGHAAQSNGFHFRSSGVVLDKLASPKPNEFIARTYLRSGDLDVDVNVPITIDCTCKTPEEDDPQCKFKFEPGTPTASAHLDNWIFDVWEVVTFGLSNLLTDALDDALGDGIQAAIREDAGFNAVTQKVAACPKVSWVVQSTNRYHLESTFRWSESTPELPVTISTLNALDAMCHELP